jgi:hemerythrin-like domain-containing protein
MDSVDLRHENRQMVESVLAILETLAARLNTGEPLPNAILGDVVEFLRECENAASNASEPSAGNPYLAGSVAQRQTARVILHKMQWALESLERGEAGAVGAFVISAREYIRAYRDHIQPPLPDWAETPKHRAVLRRFNRLIERYRDLTDRPTPPQA